VIFPLFLELLKCLSKSLSRFEVLLVESSLSCQLMEFEDTLSIPEELAWLTGNSFMKEFFVLKRPISSLVPMDEQSILLIPS